MKFERFFLITLGSVFTLLLSLPSQAADKLSTLEAIWNSAELQQISAPKKVTKKAPSKKTSQQLIAARQKIKNEQLAKQRAQQAAASKNSADKLAQQAADKLARQRKIWKAKWDAEQLAKKQQLSQRQKPVQKQQLAAEKSFITDKQALAIIGKQKPSLAGKPNLELTAAELALAEIKPAKKIPNKTIVKTPNKPLTKAQYQWIWEQKQLQKKQLAKGKAPAFTNESIKKYASKPVLPKKKNIASKPNNQKATYDVLPYVVRNKLNKAKLNKYAMSAYVQEVNSSKPLLKHQEKTNRVPASLMKLITSYAALGTLGPKYRWPTDVLTNGVVRNGTLQGDLIVKGYGSPEFDQTELRKILQGIKKKGIRNVNGRVVFDNSYFNVVDGPSFDGKPQSAYNAQPDALLYNERISRFHVRAKGNKVNVSTTTPTHNMQIINRMKKVSRGCRPRIAVSNKGVKTVVTFSGSFSSRCGKRTYSRVISDPAEMIYGAMKSMWKHEVGGNLQTEFVMGRAPANARRLVRTHSRTLAEVLPAIDKDSNNVMARQVLLTIGARKKGQGTQRGGAAAISEWLVSKGLNFPELRIENGSGLSRHARITARHVGDLLIHAYRSPYRDILMQSLAVAGVDGTMKRRLRGSSVRGHGFFKTGTLKNVRSIAGYVKAADGKTYVMAIIHNDPRARTRGRAAHDKLIEWVYSGDSQRLAKR